MTLQDEEANPKMALDRKQASIKDVLTNFCGYTTAHGLGRLAESQGAFRRATWSLFCFGALTMFVIQIYNLFLIYLGRPVATVVNVHHESNVRFPAVTICNLNMVRYDKLPADFIRNIVAGVLDDGGSSGYAQTDTTTNAQPVRATNAPSGPETSYDTDTVAVPSIPGTTSSVTGSNAATAKAPIDNTTSSQNNSTTTSAGIQSVNNDVTTGNSATGGPGTGIPSDSSSDVITSSSREDGNSNQDVNTDSLDNDDYISDYDYDYDLGFDFGGLEGQSKATDFKIEEAIRAELALFNDSTIFDIGHQFEDFVFECSYRRYDCRNYSRFWSYLWDYRHGNCFMFNGGKDDEGKMQKVLRSHTTGPTGGLKLNLFIQQSQYIAELSHTAGAKVMIHDQGQIPFPYNEGYRVLPSRSTSFAIRRTVIERIDPFNNGSCVSKSDLNRNNLYAKKFNASYSRQACLNSCQAEKQITKCGCVGGEFPVSDAESCNARDQSTSKCLEGIQLLLLTGELDCESQCSTPCREVQFGTTLSMGQWPSEGYEHILEGRVKENSALATEKKHGYFLGENFLQVNVFYDQLNYEKVTERISYEGVNLVADIGGQLGLWIGISVLTCCEFLELLLIIIRTIFERFSRTHIVHVKS
ncbi:PREDICTED: degenerin deg-1-like [Acropora digitifera]|uniref:degenerin deg-1-like n=1 Tax=Acropora digitifera TaxID=70779 RepID=UPI00077A9165|nr:PREDICTED: degenerin deg-1-like [Acropora digitifera]XP_015764093.1 PREDICTED: degenerin deg-1-like [Acropora digitifera]XP_015764095.1 PREDICTED: degenerin deg-1-like [Acropora digitifera]